MRLSEALSPTVWVPVKFAGGSTLRVKYRPSQATMAELQSMTEEGGDPGQQVSRIVHQFLELIEDWEEDGETKVDLTVERLMNIPANIFRTVLTTVMKHQSAGEAESS